jgi:hypothetical protein
VIKNGLGRPPEAGFLDPRHEPTDWYRVHVEIEDAALCVARVLA